MGVKNLYKVVEPTSIIGYAGLAGKSIALDASYEIYKASHSMHNVNNLTDSDGKSTVMLTVMLNSIKLYKKSGVKDIIYVFDCPQQNTIKLKENRKRDIEKKARERKMTPLDKSERSFSMTTEVVKELQIVLSMLGISWTTAQNGFEAEHLGAALTQNGTVDYLITADSDAIPFGCTKLLVNQKKEFRVYDITQLPYTREEFARIGVIMGCDFSAKTKGIGIKTIDRKFKAVELTEEQEAAREYFLSDCPISEIMHSKYNKDKTVAYLTRRGFSISRIGQLLALF